MVWLFFTIHRSSARSKGRAQRVSCISSLQGVEGIGELHICLSLRCRSCPSATVNEVTAVLLQTLDLRESQATGRDVTVWYLHTVGWSLFFFMTISFSVTRVSEKSYDSLWGGVGRWDVCVRQKAKWWENSLAARVAPGVWLGCRAGLNKQLSPAAD